MDENMKKELIEELVQIQIDLDKQEEMTQAIRDERNQILRRIFNETPDSFTAGGYQFVRSTRVSYDLDEYSKADPVLVGSIKMARTLLGNLETTWKDNAKCNGIGATKNYTYGAKKVN